MDRSLDDCKRLGIATFDVTDYEGTYQKVTDMVRVNLASKKQD